MEKVQSDPMLIFLMETDLYPVIVYAHSIPLDGGIHVSSKHRSQCVNLPQRDKCQVLIYLALTV